MAEKNRAVRHNSKEPTVYELGDLVLLVPTQKPAKLLPRLLGPYKLIAKLTEHVVKLQAINDPSRMLNAHVARLRPFKALDDVDIHQTGTLLDVDDHEPRVSAILSHTGSSRRNVKFIVKWDGDGPGGDTSEPWKNMVDHDGTINEQLLSYLNAHPDLKKSLKINHDGDS